MSRESNLSYLNSIYAQSSNDIVILYGSRYVGIRSVISDFIRDKDSFYFKARPCEVNLQLSLIAHDLAAKTRISETILGDFSSMLKYYAEQGSNKKVVVFDNFTAFLHGNKTFLNYIISLVRENLKSGTLMLVLASEDISFIENDMLKAFGKASYEIRGVVKVEGVSISEIKKAHPYLSLNELVSYYSVIGGNSVLWNLYDKNEDVRDFICKNIIRPGGYMGDHFQNPLPDELRETSVYNTILYALANGCEKLNDIFEKTGYDRAKISVYLKTLSSHGIVMKQEAIDIGAGNASKKGIYKICEPFIRFYYRFIFANLSMFFIEGEDKFYRKYIEPHFNAYREETYIDLCIEHLNELSSKSSDDPCNAFGRFFDKNNAIDFAGRDNEGRIIIGAGRFSQPHMSYSRLEEILTSCEKSRIKYDCIYLLSAIDFDQKLHLYSSVHDNVRLIDFRD